MNRDDKTHPVRKDIWLRVHECDEAFKKIVDVIKEIRSEHRDAAIGELQKYNEHLWKLTRTKGGHRSETFEFARLLTRIYATDRVSFPVGSWLLGIADFFCSKRAMELVANSVIADMRFEYSEALAAKRKRKAQWVRIKYTFAFFWTIGLARALKALGEILKRT